MTRPVVFNLNGNARSFNSAATQATGAARKLGTATRQTQTKVKGFGSTMIDIGRSAGKLAMKINMLQTNMLGLRGAFISMNAVKTAVTNFASFEEGMLKVEAVSGMAGDELTKLKSLVEQLAVETKYTGEEVLEAAFSLATMGVKGTEAFEQMLPVITQASIALGSDVASTAETLMGTMKQFGFEMSETGRVADVLVNAYTKSMLNLEKYTISMQYAGPVASAFGQKLEDIVGIMSSVADQAIDASTVGTGMRMVMLALVAPSKEAAKVLEKYGLTLQEMNPEANSLIDILGKLTDAQMTGADMEAIFGKRTIGLVSSLKKLKGEGDTVADKIRNLSKEMGEAGSSARVATHMQQGLGFAFKQAAASMSLFSTSVGSAISDAFDLEGKTKALADSFLWLVEIVKNMDFGVFKDAGIKIFDPSSIYQNLKIGFDMVLPAAISVFSTALGIGGLFMLEKISANFPMLAGGFLSLLSSGFFNIMAGGSKLFVTVIAEGLKFTVSGLAVFFNQIFAGALKAIAFAVSALPGMGPVSEMIFKEAEFRQNLTTKDYAGSIDTEEVKDTAKYFIDEYKKVAMATADVLIAAGQEELEPFATDFAAYLNEQRAGMMAKLPGEQASLQSALSQVPTSQQKKGFADLSAAVSSAGNKPQEVIEEAVKSGVVAAIEQQQITKKTFSESMSAFQGIHGLTPKAAEAVSGTSMVQDTPQLEQFSGEVQGFDEFEGSGMMRKKPQLIQISDNRIQHLYRQQSRLKQLSAQFGNRNPKGNKAK